MNIRVALKNSMKEKKQVAYVYCKTRRVRVKIFAVE